MSSVGILFQHIQNQPAANGGQVEVKNDAIGLVGFGQDEAILAIMGDETLEVFFVSEVGEDFSEFGIILDDEQEFVPLFQMVPVVDGNGIPSLQSRRMLSEARARVPDARRIGLAPTSERTCLQNMARAALTTWLTV